MPTDQLIENCGKTDGSELSGTAKLKAMPASTFAPPSTMPAADPLAQLLAPSLATVRPEFSIIICSPPANDARFSQIEGVYKQALVGEDYEIIRIQDASSMAEGYARGAAKAAGRILIFSHDDAAPVRPFGSRLRSHLQRVDIVSGAGTDRLDGPAWFTAGPPHVFGQVLNSVPARLEIKYPDGRTEVREQHPLLLSIYGVPSRLVAGIQAFDGFWFACTRGVVEQIPFDPETCDTFHMYDVDFSYRAYLAGAKIGVANDLSLMHASVGGYACPKWKPAADKWLAKYGAGLRPHHKDRRYTSAAVSGTSVPEMLAVMDQMVLRAEES